MNITLSWDLFIVVFFVIIIAYSFIIGRDNTLKVILGTYVAMIAADAGGNLFGQYLGGSVLLMKFLKLATVGTEKEAIVLVKLVVFVLLVILFAVRGAFQVTTVGDRSAPVKLILSGIYAVMSAGLIISTILVFASGISFIGGAEEPTDIILWDIYNKSQLIQTMISNSYLWFSLPALAFLIQSFYTKKE